AYFQFLRGIERVVVDRLDPDNVTVIESLVSYSDNRITFRQTFNFRQVAVYTVHGYYFLTGYDMPPLFLRYVNDLLAIDFLYQVDGNGQRVGFGMEDDAYNSGHVGSQVFQRGQLDLHLERA